jgi:hypothetical protein
MMSCEESKMDALDPPEPQVSIDSPPGRVYRA